MFPGVLAPSVVSAQATQLPDIHVVDFNVVKSHVAAGDTLQGTFTLFNNGSTDAPDVKYMVALVGEFEEANPTVVYEEKMLGTTFLAAGEKKTLTLAYTLPPNIAGSGLGLRLQTIFGGRYLGWSDVRIAVAGNASILTVDRAVLVIGGKEYSPETGPVVPQDGKVSYKVTFSNPTTKSVTVTPSIKIYDRLSTGKLLEEVVGKPITVAARAKVSTTINLPTFEYKPLVYAGVATFMNAEGQIGAPEQTFRYMILGAITTIQTASIDKKSVASGDMVNVTVLYTQPPFDQYTHTRPEIGQAQLKVVLVNENQEEIGQGSAIIDFEKGETSAVVPVVASKNARGISVSATILKDGNVLSSYNAMLSNSATSNVASETEAANQVLWILLTALIVLIVIAVACLGWLVYSIIKGKNRHFTSGMGSNSGITLPILIIIVSTMFALSLVSTQVRAYVETAENPEFALTANGVSENPHLWINNPYDGQVVAPGSQIVITGRQEFYNCSNESAFISIIKANLNGQEVEESFAYYKKGGGHKVVSNFTMPALTAPTTPGTYRINFRDDTYATAIYDPTVVWHMWSEGYVTIVVSGSQMTAPVISATTPPPGTGMSGGQCSGAISLSWTAVNGATGYDLFRDSDPVRINSGGTQRTYVDMDIAPNSSHSYYVIATSAGGNSPRSNTVTQVASQCLSMSVSVSGTPAAPGLNETVQWTATPVGGQAPYTYTWTGVTGTTQTVSTSYSTPGPKTATVTVRSNDGQIATNSGTVTVAPSSTMSSIQCGATPTEAFIGEPITWSAQPQPASGTYSYSWSGDDGLTGTTQSVQKVYSTVGLKRAQVDVVGVGSAPDCQAQITIKVKPKFQEF